MPFFLANQNESRHASFMKSTLITVSLVIGFLLVIEAPASVRHVEILFGEGLGWSPNHSQACDISIRYANVDLHNGCRALRGYLISSDLGQRCHCATVRRANGRLVECTSRIRGKCEIDYER